MDELLKMLLGADISKLGVPEKEIKCKRLSKVLGGDAVIKIKALSFDRLEELRDMAKGGALRLMICAEGIQGFDFGNAALREKLGVDTALPKTEVLKKLFTPGEIDDIYIEISELSGYSRKTIEEVKKK